MNPSTFFLVIIVSLGMVAMGKGAGIPDSKLDRTNVVEKTLTAQEIHGKILVTPFGYKQVLLQNREAKVDCWVCSQPCSSTICCNDGWPQCCTWEGLCGCCSV